MKKILFLILVIISSTFIISSFHASSNGNPCPFCDSSVLNLQQFYEDDHVIALYSHKPVLPGHSLIIPKRHVERFEDLNEDEITQIAKVIKKVNIAVSKAFGTSSYLILQKNGVEVGQTVPHVHFHYIPRKEGDTSTLVFLFQFYTASFKSPIEPETMQQIVSNIKANME